MVYVFIVVRTVLVRHLKPGGSNLKSRLGNNSPSITDILHLLKKPADT